MKIRRREYGELQQNHPEIAGLLKAVVGEKRFFRGGSGQSRLCARRDAHLRKVFSEVVCEAETTEEVSSIVKICAANRIR
jgi:FAD/FMN-containing dehydrogenase